MTREEQEEKLRSENLRRENRERHAILASLFTHDSFLWVFSLLLLIHLLLMLMLSSSHQKQSFLSSCVQALLSSYCSFLCHSFPLNILPSDNIYTFENKIERLTLYFFLFPVCRFFLLPSSFSSIYFSFLFQPHPLLSSGLNVVSP